MQIIAILLCAAGLAAWHALSRPTISRDGMQMVRMARYMQLDLPAAMKEVDQHPLYPMLVMAAHWLVGPPAGFDSTAGWIAAGTLVSIAARLALFWPLMLLTRELFDRRTAILAAWICVFLPDVAVHSADVLTESTYLFFLVLAAFLAIRTIRPVSDTFFDAGPACPAAAASDRRWSYALGAGLASGLAYLTRPEGGVIAVVAAAWLAVALAVAVAKPALRGAARGRALRLGLVVGGFVALTLPYMIYMGSVWPKGEKLESVINMLAHPASSPAACVGGGLLAEEGSLLRLPRAMMQFVLNYAAALRWLYFVLIVGAVFDGGRRLRTRTGAGFIAAVFAVTILGLAALYAVHGYMDRRHVLGPVLLTLPWAALGVQRLGLRLSQGAAALRARLKRQKEDGSRATRLNERRTPRLLSPGAFCVLLLLCGVGLCAWPLASVPDGDKAPFKEAADWLRHQPDDGRPVLDPFGAAAFYSGRRWIDWPARDLTPVKIHARFNRNLRQLVRLEGGTGAVVDWHRPLSLTEEVQGDPALRPRYLLWNAEFVNRNLDRGYMLFRLREAREQDNPQFADSITKYCGDNGETARRFLDRAEKTNQLPRRIPDPVLLGLFFPESMPLIREVAVFGDSDKTRIRIYELTYKDESASASAPASEPAL